MDRLPSQTFSNKGADQPHEVGDETHRIIGEIARRHGVVLTADDPLFMVLTGMDLLVERYLERADGLFQMRSESAFNAIEQAAAHAKATGEGIVTAAADYVENRIKSGVGDLSEALTRSAAAERARLELVAKEAKRHYWLSALLFGLTAAIWSGVIIGTWLVPVAADRFHHCPNFTQQIPSLSALWISHRLSNPRRPRLRNTGRLTWTALPSKRTSALPTIWLSQP